MPDKYIIQRRTASGLETVAELPALENGKINLSWLPVVGNMGSAIIEHGSNANGEYVRWADGTQVCWGRFDFEFNQTSTYQPVSVTPPAAFNISYPIAGTAYHGSMPGKPMVLVNFGWNGSFFNFGFYAIEELPTVIQVSNIRWFVIGRWK